MSPGWTRPVALCAWTSTLVLGAVAVALVPVTGFRAVEEPVFVAAMLAMSTVGILVVVHQPANRVAWLLMAVAFAGSLTSFGPQVGLYAVEQSSLGGGVGRAGLELRNLGIVGYTGGLSLLGLTAPDGRLPASRWRLARWVPISFVAAAGVFTVIEFSRLQPVDAAAAIRTDVVFDTANNAGRQAAILIVGEVVIGVLLLASVLVGAAALVARLRSSHGDERQQLKWIVAGVVVALALPFLTLTEAAMAPLDVFGPLIPGLTALAVSVGFGLALFRYRLYDVDLVINRSLVYGALTTGMVGIYVGVVWALGSAVGGGSGGLGVSLAGAAVVALVANPARLRLKRLVNRAMFGDRDDPYQVLRRLRSSLERALTPAEALQEATADIAQALRLRFVAIDADTSDGVDRLAVWGVETDDAIAVRLRHQGIDIGRLLVAARSPAEVLGEADRVVLADVAAQVAAAVFVARLTGELRGSRQRLVTAREEERRRLRRDLHDGLGPTLAAFTLQLDTARDLVRADPDRAEALLERLQAEAGTATDDIRRLVYDLRPPALDELGLLGALQQQASRLGNGGHGAGTTIEVTATKGTESLPAAVEVAAYRIATEAMTNAARHAHARTCLVHVARDDVLELDITDDGRGLPETPTAGIGLRSIVERAEELDGTVTISPAVGGGTLVSARLPLVDQPKPVP